MKIVLICSKQISLFGFDLLLIRDEEEFLGFLELHRPQDRVFVDLGKKNGKNERKSR